MEAICSSETSVNFQRTTRRYIPEDSTLHNHRCENLKSYNIEHAHSIESTEFVDKMSDYRFIRKESYPWRQSGWAFTTVSKSMSVPATATRCSCPGSGRNIFWSRHTFKTDKFETPNNRSVERTGYWLLWTETKNSFRGRINILVSTWTRHTFKNNLDFIKWRGIIRLNIQWNA
jgi:hypothetical protein